MLSTKDIYMKACMQSKELHAMTDDERTKLQSHLLKMYKDIENICDAHNLKMCTAYGTVLGAIRHQGFIPWDDDMDLCMPREDYEKFINIYSKELSDNYKVYAPNSKNGPIARFAKVVDTETRFICPGEKDDECSGIFVDIFPLEYTSNSINIVKAKRIITMFFMVVSSSVAQYEAKDALYKRIMCSSAKGKRTYKLRNLIGFVFSFKSSSYWFNLLDKFNQKKKHTQYYSVPAVLAMSSNIPLPDSLFFPAKKMKFEDIEVYVPNKPERHCEICYGDWHIIPPEEDRWQHFIKEIRF